MCSVIIFCQLHAFFVFFFFFSSRRRHTRWTGDWSSDVCSSDLRVQIIEAQTRATEPLPPAPAVAVTEPPTGLVIPPPSRSEERRVGKECRSRRSPAR